MSRLLPQETLERIARLRNGGYGFAEIAVRVRLRRSTVAKIVQRGYVRFASRRRPPPPDLTLWAARETIRELCQRYRATSATINRWLAEKRFTRPSMRHQRPLRPVPADFAQRAPSMTNREQCAAWHASGLVITRWRREVGLPTPRADYCDRKRARAAR